VTAKSNKRSYAVLASASLVLGGLAAVYCGAGLILAALAPESWSSYDEPVSMTVREALARVEVRVCALLCSPVGLVIGVIAFLAYRSPIREKRLALGAMILNAAVLVAMFSVILWGATR
jgi:hypothetical protein